MGLFSNLGQYNNGLTQTYEKLNPGWQQKRDDAWAKFDPSNLTGNLDPELLKYGGVDPTGRYQLSAVTQGGNPEFGDYGTVSGYNLWDLQNSGAGKDFYNFNSDGSFNKTMKGASTKGTWIAPLAAAISMGTLLPAAAGAGAVGGGASALGSTFTPGMWGASAVPAGSGFGALGSTAGGLSSSMGLAGSSFGGALGAGAGLGSGLGASFGLGTTLGEGVAAGAGSSFNPGMFSGEVPAGSGFNLSPSQLPPTEFTPGQTPFNYGGGVNAPTGGLESMLDKLGSGQLSNAGKIASTVMQNQQNKQNKATLSDVLNLAGGAYGAQAQGDAADKMMAWMKGQQDKIDKMYNPGTAEYDALWNEMSRKDAASGRNSQYGVRSTDLAGKIAGIKSDANVRLTGALSGPYARALQQDAAKYSGVTAPLGSLFENTELSDLSSIFSGLGISGDDISSFLNSFGAG